MITPGPLLTIAAAADPVDVAQTNFENIAKDLYGFNATRQSGVESTIIGPPTAGTWSVDDKWVDAWQATWRCTVAGTPGTWRQETPAVRASEPGSGTIPTGYLICDASYRYALKRHLGSYSWAPVYADYQQTHCTSFTGGSSGALDAVATTNLPVGALAYVYDTASGSGYAAVKSVYTFRLETGTDAEVSPWVVRPDDYNGSTNTKVWKRIDEQIKSMGVSSYVSTLADGADTDLIKIPTVDLPIGFSITFRISETLYTYQLRESTDGTESLYKYRPADFQSVTNPKVWYLLKLEKSGGDGSQYWSSVLFGQGGTKYGNVSSHSQGVQLALGYSDSLLDQVWFTVATGGKLTIQAIGNLVTISAMLSIKSSAPASATATGVAGTITWDSSYIYICTATNTWKRVAIATW